MSTTSTVKSFLEEEAHFDLFVSWFCILSIRSIIDHCMKVNELCSPSNVFTNLL